MMIFHSYVSLPGRVLVLTHCQLTPRCQGKTRHIAGLTESWKDGSSSGTPGRSVSAERLWQDTDSFGCQKKNSDWKWFHQSTAMVNNFKGIQFWFIWVGYQWLEMDINPILDPFSIFSLNSHLTLGKIPILMTQNSVPPKKNEISPSFLRVLSLNHRFSTQSIDQHFSIAPGGCGSIGSLSGHHQVSESSMSHLWAIGTIRSVGGQWSTTWPI